MNQSIHQKVYRRAPATLCHFFPQFIWRGTNKIYLTFDDGPHPEFTPKLMALLAEHRVSASFFLIGKNVEREPNLADELSEAGHIIGNHSWSHPNLRWKNRISIRDEMLRCHELIAEMKSFQYIFRPPYGAFGINLLRESKKLGYQLTMWSYSPSDYLTEYWQQNNLSVELKHLPKTGDVILLHDGHPNSAATIAALKNAIPFLLDKGYTFGTLDELIE